MNTETTKPGLDVEKIVETHKIEIDEAKKMLNSRLDMIFAKTLNPGISRQIAGEISYGLKMAAHSGIISIDDMKLILEGAGEIILAAVDLATSIQKKIDPQTSGKGTTLLN